MTTQPWYRTALRWGQTNLVEADPARYDAAWWRAQWRRTNVQGVIVNAGGIVAYYPSEMPLHYRALTLGDRDLFGEIVAAAREEGLRVIARMDSNRVAEDFYRAHPDWIAVDVEGKPFRQADKYVTCINSPYYSDYLPRVMEEVIRRYQPDGFSDNSWPGMSRERICHCTNCATAFRAKTGLALPRKADWGSETYRLWIRWNYDLRTALWEQNNRITQAAGGADCVWSGMISGDVLSNGQRFIDLKAILARTPIIMLDHQRRSGIDGFEQNTEAGKRLHGLIGWDALIPESMPQYQLGAPSFRVASMQPAEVRLWSSAAFAGGIQPWWHHIGAMHEDRRQYTTAAPIFAWHAANQDVLGNRVPQADVGVVWSQENHDYHGQGDAQDATMHPYRGVLKALDKAGIDFLPVHADDIAAATGRFGVLILPNLGVMSDAQVTALRGFVAAGGSVIATGDTSILGEFGAPRSDFALGDLFGVHRKRGDRGSQAPIDANIELYNRHTYLRLSPELRAGVDGPQDATAPAATGTRHPVLAGLEQADVIPFGGFLGNVSVDPGVEVLATFVPEFPIFPPETSWMREPKTDIVAITQRTAASGAKLVWFAADIDRCFARDDNGEHGMMIANAVRWMLDGRLAVSLTGARSCISPSLYRQGSRQILHLNNRIQTSRVPGRMAELIPIGPVTVRLRIDGTATPPAEVALRVAGIRVPAHMEGGALVFDVPEILDHEVVVADWG